MSFFDVVSRAKASGDPALFTEAVPYALFLGLSAESRDGGLVTRLAFSDMLIGNPALPALHGGVVGALLEHAAIFHLMWEVEITRMPKTISVTIDYLRSARPRDTFAKGIITKHGRRVANVRVEAWQDDPARPVAHAHSHFLLA